MSNFIGRIEALGRLSALTEKRTASFVVVRGRRRIGKSRLIKEFSKQFDTFYQFMGLPPEKDITTQDQLTIFSRQLAEQCKTPPIIYDNWSNALWTLGKETTSGKILLLFDEISWMGSKDPTFLGNIKNLWDQYLKNNDKLIFVICGSASSWIEKNILSSTGFVGRISLTLTLQELSLKECSGFWPKNISAYEKLKVLAVTGGVPKYLEEIDSKKPAEENIKRLCFSHGGMLVNEFNHIFSDLFLRDSVFYKKIVEVLATGTKERQEICDALGIESSGRISTYLSELELAGFIVREHTWVMPSGVTSKLHKYRLSDNYVRFYLKYIDKNITKINLNEYSLKSLTLFPEWNTIMGLQFENLVLNNRTLLYQALGIKPDEVILANPFFQNKTYRSSGCQIDFMIQTKFSSLYICEIKFSKNVIGESIIDEVQKKIDSLMYPKGYSCRPVLIHVNGVSQDVIDRDYFTDIIDVTKFLE